MKNRVLCSFLALILLNCNQEFNDKQKTSLANTIDYIVNQEDLNIKDCYIVDSYYRSLNISDFYDSPDTSFVELFDDNKDYFSKLEKETNKSYENVFSEYLGNFSSCDESNFIIKISGLNESIILATLEKSNSIIDKKQLLNERDFEKNEKLYYIFVLNKDGAIKDVLKNAVTYW